jgi:DNA-directed RNA polymerase beta subunit
MMHQEVLLPGHLLQQFMKERLQDWQARLKECLLKEVQDKPSATFDDAVAIEKCVTRACGYADIGKRMEYLLATGNLVSRSGMGLSQTSGFTIVAEKLNFLRYLSHFRSVHRGAYFQELRTTTARSRASARLSRRRQRCCACPDHTTGRVHCARRFASCSPTLGGSCALCTRLTGRRAAC